MFSSWRGAALQNIIAQAFAKTKTKKICRVKQSKESITVVVVVAVASGSSGGGGGWLFKEFVGD